MLVEATRQAGKEQKMLSFNIPEPAKLKENSSDRSELFSKQSVQIKNIAMPKVSPFAKSIQIKKHGIKLFSEEDEYLCN